MPSNTTSRMPRRNRVDPWSDMHAVPERQMFTGNRGCLVDEDGRIVRHHNGSLWIICLTAFRDWRHPLAAPRTWTPLFFLDDAAALAAGHRPCGLCRRNDYLSYRQAVTTATRPTPSAGSATKPVLANELNRRLARERHRRGRGLDRAGDRILVSRPLAGLPIGAVIAEPGTGHPLLVGSEGLQRFGFDGWEPPLPASQDATVDVLTPPTSLAALSNGFVPRLHHTAVVAC